jgi:hypothetical protein
MSSTAEGVGVAPGGLAGAFAGVDAIVASEEILLLDDLWTSALDDLEADDPAGVQSQAEDFGQLVERMDHALAELPERLQKLEGILNEVSDDEVSDTLSKIVGDNEIDQDALAKVFGADITEIGPRGAAILACQFLQEEVGRERGILASKYSVLVSGAVPDPDLRPIFRCALYLAKLGASAAAVIGSHGLVLAYHVGKVVTTGLMGWRRSQCIATWNEITHGRHE